jgi:undecaprenyl diphosphate synthase
VTDANSLKGANVGIIPDGNRRWAKQNNQPLDKAYWFAMCRLAEVVEVFLMHGAASVSIFALSKDNLERPTDDLAAVFAAEERFFTELLPPIKAKYSCTVFHAGSADVLPSSYREALRTICDATGDRLDSSPSIFLCAAYDPYDEIAVAQTGLSQSNDLISRLWVPRALDLVLRTGGECRLSGFLPLQSKYAEIFFESYYFPEITRSLVESLIARFLTRNRRFGKSS